MTAKKVLKMPFLASMQPIKIGISCFECTSIGKFTALPVSVNKSMHYNYLPPPRKFGHATPLTVIFVVDFVHVRVLLYLLMYLFVGK